MVSQKPMEKSTISTLENFRRNLLLDYFFVVNRIKDNWHGYFYYKLNRWYLWLKTDINNPLAYIEYCLFWGFDSRVSFDEAQESINHLRSLK